VLRPAAFVLLRIDPPRDLARREAALVEIALADDALDQAQLVVRIEHLETFGQLRILPVQTQQAMREAVEGTDPHPARAARHQRARAMAHLVGGLVGERHREDAVRGHAERLVQPGDAVDQHAGLARSCAGEDQLVSGRCAHGLALGRVQPGEQMRYIHARILRDGDVVGDQSAGIQANLA
jgi:hypothetical protein